MFRLVKILIILILQISGITQAASLKDLFSNKIDHFTIEDGLPENSVRCIEKDDYGNYWICTKGGLARYDGYDFETITEDRLGSKLHRAIRDIKIKGDILYVATEDNLFTLNLLSGLIEKVLLGPYDNVYVYKIYFMDDEILIGTDIGLLTIKNGKVTSKITHHKIRELLVIDGVLLFSSINKGLYKLPVKDLGRSEPVKVLGNKNSYILQIKRIDNKIYLSTYGAGLYVLGLDFQILAHLIECQDVGCLPTNIATSVDMINDQIIVSTRLGLVNINSQNQNIDRLLLSTQLANRYITDDVQFIKSFDDSIWIGLSPGGLIRFNKKIDGVESFDTISSASQSLDTGIYSVAKIDEELYIGTYNGLFKLNFSSNLIERVETIPHTFRLGAICQFFGEGILLSGHKGVFLYDTSLDKLTLIDEQTSDKVSLDNRCNDDMSVFAFGEKIALVKKSNKNELIIQKFNSRVMAVEIHQNLIYVSSGKHIYIFKLINNKLSLDTKIETPDTVYFFKINQSDIYAFTLYDLYHISSGSLVKNPYQLSKLHNDVSIYSAEFVENDLWITSNIGVLKLSENRPASLYTQYQGIGDKEFNSKATYYDKSLKKLYLGGLTRLTSIDINTIRLSVPRRRNILSQITRYSPDGNISSVSYAHPEQMEVNEGDTLRFNIGEISSSIRREEHFKYKIESSYGENVISLQPKQKTVSLVNIGPDDFSVKFLFSDYQITFDVTPVIYKRWWAYAIYLTIFITICYFISKHFQRIQASKHNEEFIKKQLDSKRQQLASLSHELRTPLNSIIGILSSKDIDNEKRGYLQSSSFLLRSLIDNVLNNASTEVGNKLVIEKDEIDLREQITAAKNILNPYLESANIRVNIVIHDSTPNRISCDGTKLQQVIINLIKNSIKHSKTANQIIIEVSEKNGQIYIAISDNGKGVPENSHEKIFEVFHKEKDNSSGFGLGLHISKKICCHMGGDLVIDSEYKLGARFIMSFAFDKISTNRNSNDEIYMPTKGRPKKLLILEDDPLNSYAIKLLLNKISHDDYQMCATLNEFNKAFSDVYEVIILDLNFGADINGVDLAELLRQRNYTGEIYIHSAETASEVIEASESYVTSYLIKPVKIRDLESISFYWS